VHINAEPKLEELNLIQVTSLRKLTFFFGIFLGVTDMMSCR
jgi:hypothetical protein